MEKLSTKIIIKRIHEKFGNKYNTSKVVYEDTKTKFWLECKIHGWFEICANKLFSGVGCYECGLEIIRSLKQKSKKDVIKDIENMSVKCFNVKWQVVKFIGEYKNSHNKIECFCPSHNNTFIRIIGNIFARSSGCNFCTGTNINETLTGNVLKTLKFEIKNHYIIKYNDSTMYGDFYLPYLNIIIEYNGLQHYKPLLRSKMKMTNKDAEEIFKKQQLRDQELRDYCKDNNIQLIEIDGREYKGYDKIKAYLTSHPILKPHLQE